MIIGGLIMHHAFQDFIDALEHSTDAVALRTALSKAAENLELPNFAYLGFTDNAAAQEKPLLIATYPVKWTDHYFEEQYERVDPVVSVARSNLLPFHWSQVEFGGRLTKKQAQLFDEASEFGIEHGFTIPIHDGPRRVATLNFATDQKLTDFHKNVTQHRHILHLMSIYFHAHVRRKSQCTPPPGSHGLSLATQRAAVTLLDIDPQWRMDGLCR